jgi:hypothetical protein
MVGSRGRSIQKPRGLVILCEEDASSECQGVGGYCEEGGCRLRPALLRNEACSALHRPSAPW